MSVEYLVTLGKLGLLSKENVAAAICEMISATVPNEAALPPPCHPIISQSGKTSQENKISKLELRDSFSLSDDYIATFYVEVNSTDEGFEHKESKYVFTKSAKGLSKILLNDLQHSFDTGSRIMNEEAIADVFGWGELLLDWLLGEPVIIVKKFWRGHVSPRLDTSMVSNLPSHMSVKLPSATYGWVHHIPVFKERSPPGSITGKWMTFHDDSMIDSKWVRAKQLFDAGMLPGVQSMKVSGSIGKKYEQSVIIYYCSYNPKLPIECKQIGTSIVSAMKYSWRCYFKTDEMTHAGIYAINGQCASKMSIPGYSSSLEDVYTSD